MALDLNDDEFNTRSSQRRFAILRLRMTKKVLIDPFIHDWENPIRDAQFETRVISGDAKAILAKFAF